MTTSQWNEADLGKLRHLAQLNGVAIEFWDWSNQHRLISPETLLKVLETLGVPIGPDSKSSDLERAIAWTDEQPWRKTLPDCTVVRFGTSREVPIHLIDGFDLKAWADLEDGTSVELEQLDRYCPPRLVDGKLLGRATFSVPDTLPLGYHQIRTEITGPADYFRSESRPLYVVPQRLTPPALDGDSRYWGVNVQAYSVRSSGSWGIGDAEDLADLTSIFAKEKADFILINPLHASEPVSPVEDSPYLPVSRRWMNLNYIRPEIIPEYARLGLRASARIKQDRLEAAEAPANRGGGINRDQSWESKKKALEVIFPVARSLHRQAELDRFIEEGGLDLRRYALWCALAEYYGTAELPAEVATPDSPRTKELEVELAERIKFYQWAQWIAVQQCREPNEVAKRLGMPIGIMADLAVGVAGFGAEFWSNQDQFAASMGVGAPPDMYSQQGQNWTQPPWNPRALEKAGYAPLRDVMRATISLSGAIRIDHILGLFRLWWIPDGAAASEGTYVYYDHEAMIGILLLEAHRHGSLVIGEDLGTVEPWVRSYLSDRGILGTSVVWFEKEDSGWPLHADQYRRDALSTVNTHDLPPTAGYLEGVHTQLRDQLGILVDPVEELEAADREEQEQMKIRLKDWMLVGDNPTQQEYLDALHRYVARTPSRLVAAALVDMVGEKQPQNLPGTDDEYPNWRVPLSDSEGKEILLDDLADRSDLQHLCQVMREELDS